MLAAADQKAVKIMLKLLSPANPRQDEIGFTHQLGAGSTHFFSLLVLFSSFLFCFYLSEVHHGIDNTMGLVITLNISIGIKFFFLLLYGVLFSLLLFITN